MEHWISEAACTYNNIFNGDKKKKFFLGHLQQKRKKEQVSVYKIRLLLLLLQRLVDAEL